MKKYILLANLSYLPDFGGVENSIRHLCCEYRKLGYIPLVLTSQSEHLRYKPCAKMGNAIVIRSPRKKGIWGAIVTVFNLAIFAASIDRKRKFDVVIARNQISSFFVRSFIKGYQVYLAPGFAQFQTADSNIQTKRLSGKQKILKAIKRKLNSWLDKQALIRSDRVFLFSRNMLEQAKSILNRKECIADNFQITKPGVQTSRFRPPSGEFEKLNLREKYGLPQDKFLFLCIGRLVAAKGFDIAIKAMKLTIEPSLLVIVGDGPERQTLERLIIEQGLGDRVFLKGSSSVPEDYYRLSDAFLMTSRYEPLGQTILEAASSGIEIISFSSGSETVDKKIVSNATYEVIGRFGTYVESADEKMLSVAMNAELLRGNRGHSTELLKFVHSKYTWRALAIRLIQGD